MRRFRQTLEVMGLRLLALLFRSLPRKLSLKIGEILGGLIYSIGIRVEVARDNLTRAFPELDSTQINRIARACYRHFGALMAEFARLPLLRREIVFDLVEMEGLDVLDEALKKGKGGIVVSGHFGNWELMGAAAAVMGYPVSYVVTGQQNEQVEELMDQLRRSAGIQIIKRRQATKGILKALQENRLIAVLSDQDAHEAGAFVPFFGRLASTPRGAAIFALRTGADLIFVQSHRRGADRLKVVYERISFKDLPNDQDEAVLGLTRRFTARLEQAVSRHPEQWFWMHRRWKTPPPD